MRRATDKLKLESLVIKKGSFERRSQVALSENDFSEILALEMGDANIGKEKPITDAELNKLLDRTWLVEEFDKEMAKKRDGGGEDDGFELLEPVQAEKLWTAASARSKKEEKKIHFQKFKPKTKQTEKKIQNKPNCTH